MTEPKEAPGPAASGEPAREPARESVPAWPEVPSPLSPATAPTGKDSARDPAVDAVLERLGTLASMPVSGHGDAYEALHDELLKALNEDVAGPASPGQAGAAPVLQDHSTDRGTPHDDQA